MAGKGKAEGAMSPGALRRCCMDYPGDGAGDPSCLIQKERKLSKGEAAGGSDSSSKDGSIQSDTSLDSEDSCVSVIFIPHPEGRFGDGSGEAIAAGE